MRTQAHSEHEVEISENLPGIAPGDLTAMLIAVVGTIVAIVLAATGPGVDSTAGAAQILIAMGISLINMAHVVGIVLFESVSYHGAWQSFARTLSLVATPTAVLANLMLTLVG